MLRQINQEESILMSVATNGSAGVTVFVRVSDNRYARVPAGAAERDRLTWDSYYPAAPFSVYSVNSTIITEMLFLYAIIQQTVK